MRATGIVRRIDDLGRVVIPKEIRKALHIKEGDPLELYTTEDGVCLKKYEVDNLLVSHMKAVADDLDRIYGRYDYAQKVRELTKEIEKIVTE
jgi:AbrB family transcriptional regulator (stage V sporulation protein T)